MFTPHDITLFNAEEINGSVIVHRTYLKGVFCDRAKARNATADGVTSGNRATLFIPFDIVARASQSGSEKHYVSPKTFHNMTDKSNVWTLEDSGEASAVPCYCIKGYCPESLSYKELKKRYDNVYAVVDIKERDFGSADMQHWEISAR